MYERLLEAIESVAIPGAPPRMSKAGAQIGLSFLETVLRQNHTRRLSEDLILGRVGVVERRIRQEISLSFLTPLQLSIGQQYTDYRAVARSDPADLPGRGSLWLPLTRVSRKQSPPVSVRDNDGRFVPTLTRGESSELFAPAIYRLLRRIMETNAATADSDTIGQLLIRENEARWLLQQAVVSLVTERAPATRRTTRARTPGTGPATGGKQREVLKNALNVLHERGELRDVLNLMRVAIDEQLLVAQLDADLTDQELTYYIPVSEPAETDGWRRRVGRSWERLVSNHQDYLVAYETVIPSGIASYHLTASTEDRSQVDDAVLVVESAAPQVRRLEQDIAYLSSELQRHQEGRLSGAQAKLLEYELQNALRLLSEVIRRRNWETDWQGLPLREAALGASLTVAAAVQSGEGLIEAKHEHRVVHASLVSHPVITTQQLAAVSTELSETALGSEISLNSRPSGEGNLSWRRSEARDARRSDVAATCLIRVTDAAGARNHDVIMFGLALTVIAYALLADSYHSLNLLDWPAARGTVSEVDAKTAILLLVPGFLYSRLDIAERGTICARLRRGPRLIALGMIGAVIGTAISFAAPMRPALGPYLGFAMVLMLILLVLLASSLGNTARQGGFTRIATRAQESYLPRWIGDSRRLAPFARRPDVVFTAVEITQRDGTDGSAR
jgi:hypothetical protein